jgi:hypothetical protein
MIAYRGWKAAQRLQKALENQYYLVFLAIPRKKAGFQRVNIQTEVDNAEILAPDGTTGWR